MVSENMERSGKKKCKLQNRNVSTYIDGLQTNAQSVKVESVKKTSQTKKTKTLHLNGVSKLLLPSDIERKQDNLPLVENLNGVRKNCRRKISVNELPGNLHWIEDNDKENFKPAVEQLEKCSSAKKNITFQCHSLHSETSTEQHIPSYRIKACFDQQSFTKLENASVVGILSQKRVLQENPTAGTSQDVYDFDDLEEYDISSKPRCKKGKRKKVESSDDEYFPSKIVRKPPKSVSSKTSTAANKRVHFKRKVLNSVCKSRTEKSTLENLLPEMDNCSTKQDLCDLDVCSSSGSSALPSGESVTNINEISTSCDLAAYVSPKTYVERNCSIEATFSSAFKTLMVNRMADFCLVEDSPHDFKGFSSLQYVSTFNNKVCENQNTLCSSVTFCNKEKKMFETQSLTVQDENGFEVSDDVVVENVNSCGKISLVEKTNMASINGTGGAANFSVMNEFHVQSESSKMKEMRVRHTFSLTDLKKICNDEKLRLKPVVCLKKLIQPSCEFSSDRECSGKEIMAEKVSALDSNKENIPPIMHQSTSKSWRQSRNSRRPAAYVSPKTYVEKDDSIEDSFDLSLRFTSENHAAVLRRNEDTSSKYGSNNGNCSISACNVDEISSSRLSGCDRDLSRCSAYQKTNGVNISSINSECATSNQIRAHGNGGTTVVSYSASKDAVCAGGRVSVGNKSDVASSDCLSSILAKSLDDSEGTNQEASLSDSHSISVSSVRNVSFVNACKPRIEVRASRGMTWGNDVSKAQIGECNKDNCFGFDQEEPEEELLSPIKIQTCTQQSGLNIVTSSTPDHGVVTVKQKVEPWRLHLYCVSSRSLKQGPATMHSFLSKSAPQPNRDVSAVVESETVASKTLHHLISEETQKVTAAVSTPAIFSVPAALDQDSSFNKQPARRVYSHSKRTKKCNLESLFEEHVTNDGKNINRKVSKKRSKKQVKNEQNMKRFLNEVSKEFEQIENFKLCVE